MSSDVGNRLSVAIVNLSIERLIALNAFTVPLLPEPQLEAIAREQGMLWGDRLISPG